MGKTGYLVLENGKIFRGERFGAEGEMTAEVVFTTGMTGYLETLTDRSYWGADGGADLPPYWQLRRYSRRL